MAGNPENVKAETARAVDQEETAEEHGGKEKLLHWLHYSHHLHLLADGVEELMEGTEETVKVARVARGIIDAQRLIRTHAQLATDLARVHMRVLNLKATMQLGG